MADKNLNLKTYFDSDLRPRPENPEDLKSFTEQLVAECESIEGTEKYKSLNRIGVHYGELDQLDKAHEAFQEAVAYFEKSNTQMYLITLLRWADIYRFEKNFDSAAKLLQKAQEILESNNFADYEDFYHQHKGKLHFDQSDFAKALSYFERALIIRNKKNNPELIASTQLAIQATKDKTKT